MRKKRAFVALDLGAESGRVMLAEFDGEHISLSEVYRFANRPARVLDHLHWPLLELWREIKAGLAKVAREHDGEIASIGVDTWGVDFGLLDANGELMRLPYHYRDPQNQGMAAEALRRASREEIFDHTGIQFMEINSLCQLLALLSHDPRALERVSTFLMIPDLFNFWLTGEKTCELTIATTTQCYDPRARDWARPLLTKMGIPTGMFLETIEPGTTVGPILPSVGEETSLRGATVVAPACHDTGSAVVAVPSEGVGHAYISSGTWSVVGIESPEPIINEQTLGWNFTNEGGVCGTTRVLRNVAGLWLVQQCRETWARQGQRISYAELTAMATQAEPFQAVIDPDYPEFLTPGDMPARVQEYCRRTGQQVRNEKGAIIRTILEGLALKYRFQLERLERIVGHELSPIHIVGGGTKNELLNQFTTDVMDRPVVAGPVESTALGNVIMQALSLGEIGSVQEGRDLVRNSFTLKYFHPSADRSEEWSSAYERLLSLSTEY